MGEHASQIPETPFIAIKQWCFLCNLGYRKKASLNLDGQNSNNLGKTSSRLSDSLSSYPRLLTY